MKKKALALTILCVLVLTVAAWPGETSASGTGLTLNSYFVGCSGNTATYDLVASDNLPLSQFHWSFGVTPTSSLTADPNTATTSFVTFQKRVTVSTVHLIGIWDSATVALSNPCID